MNTTEITSNLKSYEEMYDAIKFFNYDISSVIPKDEYEKIDLMIEYFIKKEEFDKVIILKRLIKT